MMPTPTTFFYRLRPAVRVLGCMLLVLSLVCPVCAAETTYTVLKHDTLSTIAKKHGISTQDLVRFNGLKNPDQLQVGQELRIPPKPGIAKTYTVKKGDALEKIARLHGVDVKALIAFNDLKKPDQLTVGQTLLIPESEPATATPHSPTPSLDPDLKRKLANIKVNRGKWKYIVVHHSASKRGNAKNIDRYHREERHMENGLAYHFVIGNGNGAGNGMIEVGDRWKRQIKGGHLASTALNEKCIGICLIGDFEKTTPSKRQMDSLVALTSYLQKECGIPTSRVKTHTQINPRPTKCPGKKFPTKQFLARL